MVTSTFCNDSASSGMASESSISPDWGNHPGSRIGLDMGGTLAKLIFFESDVSPSWCDGRLASFINGSLNYGLTGIRDERLTCKLNQGELAGVLHFINFRSDRLEDAARMMESMSLLKGVRSIFAAGGGAHRHKALFGDLLKIDLKPVDELGSVVVAIAWLLTISQEELFVVNHVNFSQGQALERHYLSTTVRNNIQYLCNGGDEQPLFPFLLVNIGTGVSMVMVNSPSNFERVSGTAVGGGTFWGLCQMLTNCTDFDGAMRLASEGDAGDVNLLVRDIYGGDYELPTGKKLAGSLTASFFGKPDAGDSDDAGICRALITMISQNICQIAYMNAIIRKVPKVVFTGNFLRHNDIAMQTIAYNLPAMHAAFPRPSEDVVMDQPMQAIFLKHEGYFGAIGSFLHNLPEDVSPFAPDHILHEQKSKRNRDIVTAQTPRSRSIPRKRSSQDFVARERDSED